MAQLHSTTVYGNIAATGKITGTIAASNITELSNLTDAEGVQLENINTTTISTTQWGYLGALNQELTTTSNVQFNQITVPTIYGSSLASSALLLQSTSHATLGAMTLNASQLNFQTGSTNRVTIDSAGDVTIAKDLDVGGTATFDGSTDAAYIGPASFSWGGSTTYPTIYGEDAKRYVMYVAPHIPYLKNGQRGHTGTNEGAYIRMETALPTGTLYGYWDIGTNPDNAGGTYDTFVIRKHAPIASAVTALKIDGAGDVTIAKDLDVGGTISITGANEVLHHNATPTRDKIRVWNSELYTIGMQSGITYGHINNDYAMTFQMNNNSNRGFWWGDDGHSTAQGAMSLTTNGKLTVATSISVGEGELITSPQSTTLYVNGDIYGGGTITAGSSIVLKNNISPYTDSAVQLINTIDIVNYTYKNDIHKRNRIGFISEYTPRELTDGGKVMDINSTLGVLLKAVQELHEENESLKKIIEGMNHE